MRKTSNPKGLRNAERARKLCQTDYVMQKELEHSIKKTLMNAIVSSSP